VLNLFFTGSYFTSWMVLESILVLVYEYFISVVKEGQMRFAYQEKF